MLSLHFSNAIMENLLLLTIASVVSNFALGLKNKQKVTRVLLYANNVNILILIFVGIFLNGLPESYNSRYLLTGIVYLVVPYTVFMLIPGSIAVITARYIRKLSTK